MYKLSYVPSYRNAMRVFFQNVIFSPLGFGETQYLENKLPNDDEQLVDLLCGLGAGKIVFHLYEDLEVDNMNDMEIMLIDGGNQRDYVHEQLNEILHYCLYFNKQYEFKIENNALMLSCEDNFDLYKLLNNYVHHGRLQSAHVEYS